MRFPQADRLCQQPVLRRCVFSSAKSITSSHVLSHTAWFKSEWKKSTQLNPQIKFQGFIPENPWSLITAGCSSGTSGQRMMTQLMGSCNCTSHRGPFHIHLCVQGSRVPLCSGPCSPARKSSSVKKFLLDFTVGLQLMVTSSTRIPFKQMGPLWNAWKLPGYSHGSRWCRNQPPAAMTEDSCFQ